MARQVLVPWGHVEVASTPSTPPAGTVLVYAKTDHKMYMLDSTGTETALSGGAGGTAAFEPLFWMGGV